MDEIRKAHFQNMRATLFLFQIEIKAIAVCCMGYDESFLGNFLIFYLSSFCPIHSLHHRHKVSILKDKLDEVASYIKSGTRFQNKNCKLISKAFKVIHNLSPPACPASFLSSPHPFHPPSFPVDFFLNF